MFGKKTKRKIGEAAKPEATDARLHNETLGEAWFALTGISPAVLLPQVVGTVISDGGTRPPWQWKHHNNEYILMAWPQDQPARAGVLLGGPEGAQLKPVSAFPLLEGLPNDLTVEAVHERPEGLGGDVAADMIQGKNPMWFYNPLFDRDHLDLTPGVTHTFLVSALALRLRKALLDDLTITRGPQYDAWAQDWLNKNPGANNKDVPPLKVPVQGKYFIMPGRFYGEYQVRAVVDKVQDCQLEKMPIKILFVNFPFENRSDLHLPIYASRHILGDLEPEAGWEIEAYLWLEGRIIDHESELENQAE